MLQLSVRSLCLCLSHTHTHMCTYTHTHTHVHGNTLTHGNFTLLANWHSAKWRCQQTGTQLTSMQKKLADWHLTNWYIPTKLELNLLHFHSWETFASSIHRTKCFSIFFFSSYSQADYCAAYIQRMWSA